MNFFDLYVCGGEREHNGASFDECKKKLVRTRSVTLFCPLSPSARLSESPVFGTHSHPTHHPRRHGRYRL